MPSINRRLPVATALAGSLLMGACSAPAAPDASHAQLDRDSAVGHVHGLGIDPSDGSHFVASHSGVHRVKSDGTTVRVADRWQDTMGFAVTGPGRFLASGHPDLREEQPSQLGLIRSDDAGRTWTALSLQGEADLHAIEPAKGRIYAFDSASSTVIVTTNQRAWTVIDHEAVFDLAVDPRDGTSLYATTPYGSLLVSRKGGELMPVDGAPEMGPIDWQPGGPLVGIGPDGSVWTSEDPSSSWAKRGTVPGQVTTIEAASDRWYAAYEEEVLSSADQGRRWTRVLALH